MSRYAFLYPGQGAQKIGMGKDFYEQSAEVRELFSQASDMLQLDMEALIFQENEQLHETEYTQAAMVLTSLAMTRVVRKTGIVPVITAGLSLGEYTAIAAAGGMSELDAIRLVRQRGILMQNTVPSGLGAMCAILGCDTEVIETVLHGIPGATIANYNCPGQIVITGDVHAVETAAEVLKQKGAKRTVMLHVSGPFHSPMLRPAGENLKIELENIQFHKLNIPYVTNVTGDVVQTTDDTIHLLAKQVYSPVRWMDCMKTMAAYGVDTFVEIGPGKTLTGFAKKTDRELNVINIETYADLEKLEA